MINDLVINIDNDSSITNSHQSKFKKDQFTLTEIHININRKSTSTSTEIHININRNPHQHQQTSTSTENISEALIITKEISHGNKIKNDVKNTANNNQTLDKDVERVRKNAINAEKQLKAI